MNKEIKTLMFSTLPKEEQPQMISNYTHFRIVKGGVIISSNKGLGLPKIFITNEKIAYISFY